MRNESVKRKKHRSLKPGEDERKTVSEGKPARREKGDYEEKRSQGSRLKYTPEGRKWQLGKGRVRAGQ